MSHPNQIGSGLSGWTCSRCKAFVPYGNYHSCPATGVWGEGTPAPPTTSKDHGFAYTAALQRIAAALERIADSLSAASSVSPQPEGKE